MDPSIQVLVGRLGRLGEPGVGDAPFQQQEMV